MAMKLDREKFLKTEFGAELKSCVRMWDRAITARGKSAYGSEDYNYYDRVSNRCMAQWEVYKSAVKQFYGVEYYFTRTDDFFGVVTEDNSGWLFREERDSQHGQPVPHTF